MSVLSALAVQILLDRPAWAFTCMAVAVLAALPLTTPARLGSGQAVPAA